jgi:hypothetical protein
MFNYIYNIVNDIYYGYIEVKCCNRNCNRVFKFARNNINIKGNNRDRNSNKNRNNNNNNSKTNNNNK